MTGELPRDVLCEVCGFCGIALYAHEVAGEFAGNFIDYELREASPTSYVLCGECRNRVVDALRQIADRDISQAVERRLQLLGDDA